MRLMKRVQVKNKRYFIYEAIFIILVIVFRNKGILADEGILKKINIAKQCLEIALSIVLSLFAAEVVSVCFELYLGTVGRTWILYRIQ